MITLDLQLAEAEVENYIIEQIQLKRELKMGQRYDTNPAEISAVGFPVYPEGDYVLEIQEPKSNEFNSDSGVRAGINWMFRIVDAPDSENKGKFTSFFGNELDDIGRQMNKRLLMAAAGVELNEANDKAFSASINGQDFSFNTTDKTVGQGWLAAKGKAVGAHLGINIGKKGDSQGKQFQKFSFFPVGAKVAAA